MRISVRPLALALSGILLSGASGCEAKTGKSVLSMKVGAREVKATIEGPAFISQEGNSAVITWSKHKLIVQEDRLVLDGKEMGKVPPQASRVEVDHSGGKLTVTADGAPVAATPVPD